MTEGGDPVYDTLTDVMEKVDNDSVLEAECGCVKPCYFINPVLLQEFSDKMPGWGNDNLEKGEGKIQQFILSFIFRVKVVFQNSRIC